MEIMNWLQPSIEQGVLQAAQTSDAKNAEQIKEMNAIIARLREYVPSEMAADLITLDNLLSSCAFETADTSYRMGFQDGLRILSIK